MEYLSKEKICKFVEKSILDKQYNEKLSFFLPPKTIKRVKEILYLDLLQYKGIISSHSIRHIKKGHPADTKYICEILDILQNFYRVEKSITKDYKTGSVLINLEFYKKMDNEIVKLVKLKIHREKRLELKTLFVIK